MEEFIMIKRQPTHQFWVYLLMGVIIGLLIAVGFEWNQTSKAQPPVKVVTQQSTEKPQASPADLNVAEQLSNVFASVAAEVNPSVVTIFTETKVKMSGSSGSPFDQFFGGDDFFKKFFQLPQQQGNLVQHGLGSGVIVDPNGIILTNNHVVDGAENIKVQLLDGSEFVAKVKGTDPRTDLAVITIDTKGLTPIKIGNSDKARVGDWVLAIGSPLNPELEHTVTAGIISAKGRSGVGLSQYEDYIQTDAAINPGNSGGALVNVEGELVGINSAIATQTGGNMGIGFAIPSNLAKTIMNDIIKTGKVIRGWLGVYIQNVTPEIAQAMKLSSPQGVIISKVQENSPAQKAGLKPEDVILQFNGKDVTSTVELSTWVASTSPGTTVTLKILRNDKPMDVKVKLEELNVKEEQKMAAQGQGESTFDRVGMKVANITSDLISKYQLPQNVKGVVITSVAPNGIAAEAGLQEGDVILKFNRSAVESVVQFEKIMKQVKPGDNVLFYLLRDDANLFIAFTMPQK
jgi:serine protease Do